MENYDLILVFELSRKSNRTSTTFSFVGQQAIVCEKNLAFFPSSIYQNPKRSKTHDDPIMQMIAALIEVLVGSKHFKK